MTSGRPIEKSTHLATQAKLAGWATPTTRDWRDGRASQETMERNGRPLNEQVVSGLTSNGLTAQTEGSAQLNPDFVQWLMGIPEGWLDYEP